MSTRLHRRVVAKTADYTIKPPADSAGTTFTNAGATGAVVFTLPAPTKALNGWWYRFISVVDQDVTVATATTDTLIAKHDLAADSIAASTSSEKIGAQMEFTCLETSAGTYQWVGCGISVGTTFTVATS